MGASHSASKPHPAPPALSGPLDRGRTARSGLRPMAIDLCPAGCGPEVRVPRNWPAFQHPVVRGRLVHSGCRQEATGPGALGTRTSRPLRLRGPRTTDMAGVPASCGSRTSCPLRLRGPRTTELAGVPASCGPRTSCPLRMPARGNRSRGSWYADVPSAPDADGAEYCACRRSKTAQAPPAPKRGRRSRTPCAAPSFRPEYPYTMHSKGGPR
jgi:hypothetical protein